MFCSFLLIFLITVNDNFYEEYEPLFNDEYDCRRDSVLDFFFTITYVGYLLEQYIPEY